MSNATTSPRKRPWLFAVLAGAMSLSACADPDPTAPVDDVERTDAATLVMRYLDLDLDAPPGYAVRTYPAHYGPGVLRADNSPAENPVTDAGAALGRVLFHDVELSLNRATSCASCHVQALGFTDGAVLSEGFDRGRTGAHSMRLANARFYQGEKMFWNRRADDVEDQVLQPVQDAVEMGFSAENGGLAALVRRMDGLAYYPVLFEWAFGSPDITETRMRAALAQYVRSIVSTGSRFDDGIARLGLRAPGPLAQGPIPGFTAQENLGFQLFTRPPNQGGAGCAGCHEPPTMALDEDSRSNGLDAGETVVFKAPSLKNVAVSGPYMHDGRFATLEQVVDHYGTGIQNGPALDRRLRGPNGQPIRPRFTNEEGAALVAFMRTLTDTALLADERFADPFRR